MVPWSCYLLPVAGGGILAYPLASSLVICCANQTFIASTRGGVEDETCNICIVCHLVRTSLFLSTTNAGPLDERDTSGFILDTDEDTFGLIEWPK